MSDIGYYMGNCVERIMLMVNERVERGDYSARSTACQKIGYIIEESDTPKEAHIRLMALLRHYESLLPVRLKDEHPTTTDED